MLNSKGICNNIEEVYEKINKILNNDIELIKEIIEETYGYNVYPDIFQIVRWFDGTEQPVHADGCNMDGSSNNLTWREFGSILYLNDDYTGGEIVYTEKNITYKPRAGTMIFHPGSLEYKHGVKKVIQGTRYVMTGFIWDGMMLYKKLGGK